MSMIAVASGKGGTGKTTVAAALALSLREVVSSLRFMDCDVEEPNAAVLLRPDIEGETPVVLKTPRVEPARCTGCERCREICEFNAIAVVNQQAMIFDNLCHSCGGCVLACPEDAISEMDRTIGKIEFGHRDNIEFMSGVLNVGEAMATPVIRALKARGQDARGDNNALTLIDAPPGTACPVIATVKDCDYCILVTEPTPFGVYDLDLMYQVVSELGIRAGIVVNKDDGEGLELEAYASDNDIPILMRIPLERDIAVQYSKGVPLVEVDDRWGSEFRGLYEKVRGELCQSPSK
ncbi:P-loop NTPase [Candidatus Eisenbacteria bacterium]|uniref:P-loop NTPase n=1 Tax=Eiseniibacteriota bacterium TaxID=2212470 RepID=A0ABV6YPW2_UNCEI